MKLKIEEIYKIIPYKLRNPDFIQKMYFIIEKIKKDSSTDVDLALDIIEKVTDKPGWSCFLFEGFLKGAIRDSDILPVKIGCDLNGIKIKEKLGTALMI